MFNFLRKVSGWPTPVQSPMSIPFSSSHPILANLPTITGSDILSQHLSSTFPRLNSWMMKNYSLSQSITFYIYNEKKMDSEFYNFRQYALKSQIDQGLDIIRNYEEQISNVKVGQEYVTDEYDKTINNLVEVSELKRSIKMNNLFCNVLNKKKENIINRDIRSTCLKISNLISLLCSIDAVPLNYIPVVDFSSFVLDRSYFEYNCKGCYAISLKINQFQQNILMMKQAISNISEKYKDNEESYYIQLSEFHTLLGKYRLSYDQDYRCVDYAKDCSSFNDFLNNSNTKAYTLKKKFLEEQTDTSFYELVKGLIREYEIQSEEEEYLIHSLCSIIITSSLIPPVYFNGCGIEDTDELLFGIKLFSVFDSINLLKIISEHFIDEEDPKVIVNKTSEIMKKLSPNYRQIFLQIYDFSIQEYIPSKLQKIREEIGTFIEQ